MKNCVLLLLLLVSIRDYSQTRLLGRIQNQDGGQLIENVNVIVQNTGYATTTNKEGRFELNIDQTINPIFILVSCIGYESQLISKNPNIDNLDLTIYLRESAIPLGEIKVISKTSLLKKALANYEKNYYTACQYDIFLKQVSLFDSEITRYAELLGLLSKIKNKDNKITPYKVSKAINSVFSFNKMNDNKFALKNFFDQLDVFNVLNLLINNSDLFETEIDYNSLDKSTIYKVSFTQKNIPNTIVLMIESGTYAVVSIDLIASRGIGIDKEIKVNEQYTKRAVASSGSIHFRKYNDKWILNDMEGFLGIEYRSKNNHLIQNINSFRLYTTKFYDKLMNETSGSLDLVKDIFEQNEVVKNTDVIENVISKTEKEKLFFDKYKCSN
jgi:hypothetical protein